jgi:hypothetical protein
MKKRFIYVLSHVPLMVLLFFILPVAIFVGVIDAVYWIISGKGISNSNIVYKALDFCFKIPDKICNKD